MKRVAAAVIMVSFSPWVAGQPEYSSWEGPYEYKVGTYGITDAVYLSDGVWEKYGYKLVGAQLGIGTYWSTDTNYALPNPGSQWSLEFKDPSTGQVYATYTVSYDAASNCLNGSDGLHLCDAIQPRGVYGADGIVIQVFFGFKCLSVRPWEFNGTKPDGTSRDMPFTPIRYRVKAWGPSTDGTIQPYIASSGVWAESGPDTTKVWVVVTDDQQCGFPIENATVGIVTTATDGAGHVHLADEEGTGQFTDEAGETIDSRAVSDTHLQDKSDSHGNVIGWYTGGDLGVLENIKATATQDAVSAKDPASTSDTTEALQIRYPWLVAMDPFPADGSYVFHYGGTCPHAPEAQWLNYGMRGIMLALASNYSKQFSAALSFNDGSLMYGGLLDNKLPTGGRNAGCHTYHRRGVDMDVNHQDALGTDLGTFVTTDADGAPVTRQMLLNYWAGGLGARLYPEPGSIHYRWW